MKKSLVLIPTLLASLVSAYAFAEDAKPDNSVAFNASVVSDYRYRGLSQTRLKPALQGGIDYTNNPTGFYAGAWASTIQWIKDVEGDSNFELDIYGGKRGNFTEDWTYDIGFLTYQYPSHKLEVSPNTNEVYAQIGYGVTSLKYSHSLTNLFGVDDSKGSGYLDLSSNIDLGEKYTLNLHVGKQTVKNASDLDYTDYKIGVSKDFDVVVGSIAIIGTDAEEELFTVKDKFLGKTGVVVGIAKTF